MSKEFELKLKGKTAVFVDWANVYRWKDKLKRDYATLYERLVKKGKQVVVIYMYGCLGREIWEMKRGIFKASVVKLGVDLFQKMTPDRRSRARLS